MQLARGEKVSMDDVLKAGQTMPRSHSNDHLVITSSSKATMPRSHSDPLMAQHQDCAVLPGKCATIKQDSVSHGNNGLASEGGGSDDCPHACFSSVT